MSPLPEDRFWVVHETSRGSASEVWRTSTSPQALGQVGDFVEDLLVALDQLLDLLNGVDDGRVITPSEGSSDLGEGKIGEVSAQVHSDLSVERQPDPDGSLRLPVSDIAEKFIQYYFQ